MSNNTANNSNDDNNNGNNNDKDSSVARFLVPFALGVPSRRHFVVARRAREHFQDLVKLSDEVKTRQGSDQNANFTECEQDLIRNKLLLIKTSIEELDSLSEARKAEIAAELQSLKDDWEHMTSTLDH